MKRSRQSGIILIAVTLLMLTVTTVAIAGRMRLSDPTIGTTDTTTDSGGKGKGGPKNSLEDIPLIEAGSGKGIVEIDQAPPYLFAGGTLTGLGNLDVDVEFSATIKISEVTCTNHGNQLVVAQSTTVGVTKTQNFPASTFEKNGQLVFSVKSSDDLLGDITSDEFCPNNNWKALVTGIAWNGPASIRAFQGDGQEESASFNCATTVNGNDVTVTCNPK
ncbi:MAG: hypothetical protein KDJ52_21980 [Anaerolineae bacterium]|nr:hypothetical protein [Anaerolineae bacterium]